jgi:predicted dehydrogenase
MKNGKLGAAIFGAGWVAGEHARAYQKCERAEIVAVGSRKLESAKKCAEYAGAPDAFVTTDFDALLKNPAVDLISITTPPDIHADLAVRAAKAGKHVCIEKPLALDWKSCVAMEKAIKAAGVKSITSFCLRWNPALMNIKGMIDNGAVGTPYYVEVDYLHGLKKWYPQYPWSTGKAQGGSSLLSAGCHAVDAMRWFIGEKLKVTEVTAYNVKHMGDNPDWGYDPTTVLLAKFENGTLGKTASVLDSKHPYQFKTNVIGTGGTIQNDKVWSNKMFPGQTGFATIPHIQPDSGDVTHHPFNAQMEEFVAGILDGTPILTDIDDAMKTHEIVFAADQSAETGRPVKLPLPR